MFARLKAFFASDTHDIPEVVEAPPPAPEVVLSTPPPAPSANSCQVSRLKYFDGSEIVVHECLGDTLPPMKGVRAILTSSH